MPPLVLALIDSVFALAFHHQARADRGFMPDHEGALVRASMEGPNFGDPNLQGIEIRVSITLTPRSEGAEVIEDSVAFQVDLDDERLLAGQLALAELPLDRGGLARVIGELEAWCYQRIPIHKLDDVPDAADVAVAE